MSLDYLFPLFDALGGSGGSQGDLFEHGSENVSKKEAVPLTFRVLFGAVLSPWEHLGDIWEVPDLKKDNFLGDSFLDHFLATTRAPLNVLGSVLATVSARFSQVR